MEDEEKDEVEELNEREEEDEVDFCRCQEYGWKEKGF